MLQYPLKTNGCLDSAGIAISTRNALSRLVYEQLLSSLTSLQKPYNGYCSPGSAGPQYATISMILSMYSQRMKLICRKARPFNIQLLQTSQESLIITAKMQLARSLQFLAMNQTHFYSKMRIPLEILIAIVQLIDNALQKRAMTLLKVQTCKIPLLGSPCYTAGVGVLQKTLGPPSPIYSWTSSTTPNCPLSCSL